MYEEIIQILNEHRCATNAEKQAAYLKNHFVFFGIAAQERRQLMGPYLKSWRQSSKIDWQLLTNLWQTDYRECQYVALDFLKSSQKQLIFEDVERMLPMIQTKQWWDSIDCFDQLLGTIGLSDARVGSLMLQWAEADDFWLRRIAIDHQLGRREQTNEQLLAAII